MLFKYFILLIVLIATIHAQDWFPINSCTQSCGGSGTAIYKKTGGTQTQTFNCNAKPCNFPGKACGKNLAGQQLSLQTDAKTKVVYCGAA